MFERSEADAFLDLVRAGPPELDTRAVTFDGVAVLTRPGPDASFWCQVVGFEEPPPADLIGAIVDHLRDRGVEQARFALPPHARTGDWAAIAAKYGLTPAGRTLKLAARPSLDVAPAPAVTLVEPSDHERWSQVMWRVFGLSTPANIAISVAALKQPVFRAYARWDGDEIVATGLVRLHPDGAHLFSGATISTHRGHGAQSAVIAARVAAAAEAGCPVLVAETGVVPDGYNTSARNLIRAGFEPRYERETWLWTP
ncbi:GNAT family N-acetyltransferase [Actinoplanes sp. NPDC049265]|uniref:GNAT family N-acetyltransferase n=1 Tax=Actinoplanes sp. NPDC049265 TaxID=3363902 RepID=UPI00371E6125